MSMLDLEKLCKATGLPIESFVDPETQLIDQALSFKGVDIDEVDLDQRYWLVAYLVVREKMTTTEIAEKLHSNAKTIRNYRYHAASRAWHLVLAMDQANTKAHQELLALQKYHNQCEARLSASMNRKDAQISSLIDSLRRERERYVLLEKTVKSLRAQIGV